MPSTSAATSAAAAAAVAAGVVSGKDPSSRSNPHEACVTHLKWTADVDFQSRIIRATASYKVDVVSPPSASSDSVASALRLDTSHLHILSVSVNDNPSSYELSTTDPTKPHLGRCLEIALPPKKKVVDVSIEYETTNECTAAQWLPPSQTAGKVYPYLFTQCQAIHARSLVPCQDRPGVKMTYEASVTVPSWATCVMSALSKGSDKKTNEDDTVTTFRFHQPVPISSYLFALAVGHLESIDVSSRCKVWSEPCVVQAAAAEFSQTEEFLQIAERLTLPYQWTRYDLLCLPPSFPYGGMENPCLTFVTPTLLAGDKSLADVVAHEIAHSWTGNLVTNETWQHFWLNEGWTTWLQRKIMVEVKNDGKFFDFDALGGWKALADTIGLMPEKFTKLVPDLGDDDPDDCFSRTPYENGFSLLYALEKRVGREAFAQFTKAYLNKFKFKTVSSEEFRDCVTSHFAGNKLVQEFDWDLWLYSPGMPPEKPDFDRTLSRASEELAEAWIRFDDEDEVKREVPTVNVAGWSSNQVTCFLDAIETLCETPRRAGGKRPLKISTVDAMNRTYDFGQTKNSEILSRFCQISIDAGDESILPVVTRFITTQGRMKFVRPLYRALFKSKMGKQVAVDTFLANKDFYHPICAKMVAVDLGVSSSKEENGASSSQEGSGGGATDQEKVGERYRYGIFAVGVVVAFAAGVGISVLRSRRR